MIFPADAECLNGCSKDGAVMLPPADTLRLGSDQIQSCVESLEGCAAVMLGGGGSHLINITEPVVWCWVVWLAAFTSEWQPQRDVQPAAATAAGPRWGSHWKWTLRFRRSVGPGLHPTLSDPRNGIIKKRHWLFHCVWDRQTFPLVVSEIFICVGALSGWPSTQ